MSRIHLGKHAYLESRDGSNRIAFYVHGERVAYATKKSLVAMFFDLVGCIYLPMSCPRCRRERIEFDGLQVSCEKCLWTPDDLP